MCRLIESIAHFNLLLHIILFRMHSRIKYYVLINNLAWLWKRQRANEMKGDEIKKEIKEKSTVK